MTFGLGQCAEPLIEAGLQSDRTIGPLGDSPGRPRGVRIRRSIPDPGLWPSAARHRRSADGPAIGRFTLWIAAVAHLAVRSCSW